MSRTRLVAIAAAAVALIALTALYAYSIRHDDEVSLKGIDMGELDLGGGTLLDPPNGSPVIGADQARAIVQSSKHAQSGDMLPDPEVRETRLVRFVNETTNRAIDALAWAINLSPETVPAVTPCTDFCFRSGPHIPNPTPTPSPTPFNCGPRTTHDVVIIDARTGEWLYETKSTELVVPAPGDTCPPTPTQNVGSPSP